MKLFAYNNTMDLINWIFSGQVRNEHLPVLIDPENPERNISRSSLANLIRALVKGFERYGISSGDCVLVNAFNDIYYPVVYFGIIGAGAVFTGVNPSYTTTELLHHMQL